MSESTNPSVSESTTGPIVHPSDEPKPAPEEAEEAEGEETDEEDEEDGEEADEAPAAGTDSAA